MTTNKRAGAGSSGPRRLASNKVDLEAVGQVSGRITAIEPQQKAPNRRSIYVDGAFVVGLDMETVAIRRWKVGLTIEGAALVEAARADEEKRAWDAALTFLAVTARSRREVEKRLQRFFPAEVAEKVMGRLERGGWLDDAEFARRYCQSKAGFGERRLLQELARKGIARDVAMAAVRQALGTVDATAGARELAERRLRSMAGVDRDTAHRRLAGFLARRGYDFETVSRALAPLLKDLAPAPRKLARGQRRFASEEDEQA